jgi:hypothetical protein
MWKYYIILKISNIHYTFKRKKIQKTLKIWKIKYIASTRSKVMYNERVD